MCDRHFVAVASGPTNRSSCRMGASSHPARHSLAYLIGKCTPKLSQLPPSILKTVESIMKGNSTAFINAAYYSICKGYPRTILKPDVARLLELNREACRIRADYILPQLRSADMKVDILPDELPRSIVEYGERECIAYLTWQMPFAYGCLERIFAEIKTRAPDFVPRNIFDFGVGPATAIL